MYINLFDHVVARRKRDNATHPIEPTWSALAALLLLAGTSLPRRCALPAHAMTAHSGASNRRV